MKYILFFIFVVSSFALANENVLGIVRIKSTQPLKYDASTGKIILDSQNTILKIQEVVFDEKIPGKVALVATKGDKYDALLVTFKDTDRGNIIPQRFGRYLSRHKGFQIDVTQDNLEYDTTTFLSLLKIKAENLVFRQIKNGKIVLVPLRTAICPMVPGNDWIPWTKDPPVRADCL